MSSTTMYHNFLEAFACAHVSDGFMEDNGEMMLGCFLKLQGSPLCEVKGLKDKGNKFFRQNYFDRAAACYDEACKLLGLSIGGIGGGDVQSVSELAVSLNSNLAACALKLEEYQAALDLCSMILDTFPANVKALFRRAIAFTKLKKFSEAELDLAKALVVEPKNKDVLRELDVVKGHLLVKENGKRVLGIDHEVDVDRNNKKHIEVSESLMGFKDFEHVNVEVSNDHYNHGMESDIRMKDNETVNMEVNDTLSSCGMKLGTGLKENKQVFVKPILEFSKKGGGNSHLRIPGQSYQKLLEGKELSFYRKRDLSTMTIRILNIETTKKGGTTKDICKKKKKRRRRRRRYQSGKFKTMVVMKEDMPPLDIMNTEPNVSCTSSSASSLCDNFASPATQFLQVHSVVAHDSSWPISPVTENAAFISCPKSKAGSNDHQPSLCSTSPFDQPSVSNSPEKCMFSVSCGNFQCGPSTPLFCRFPLNLQVKKRKKKRRIIALKKDYSKGDESPRHSLSTCSSSRSFSPKFLRLRGVSVSCCRYSSEAQLKKKRKDVFAHLASSDRPLKKPNLLITPFLSLVSFSNNNVIIKPDSERRVCSV